MEMLRNFLGNLGSGVIRLAVAVGILAAIGIFIVRPALKSAEKITHETNETVQKSFNQSFGKSAGLEDIDKTLEKVNKTVEVEIKKSFHFAVKHGGPANPKKLVKCIQHAEGDVHKIQRCTVKF